MKKVILLSVFLVLIQSSSSFAGFFLNVENDVFLDDIGLESLNEDRDYTMGVRIGGTGYFLGREIFSPQHVAHNWLDKSIENHINTFSGFDTAGITQYILGSTNFTPDDLRRKDVIKDDRPYASLIYLSTINIRGKKSTDELMITDFRFGILGLDIGKQVQTFIHESMNDNDTKPPYTPRGWHNQISDGGEPTFMYSVTMLQKQIKEENFELITGYNVRLGYETAGNLIITFKRGVFSKSLFTAITGIDTMAPLSVKEDEPATTIPLDPKKETEFYGYITLEPHVILYNALLNGQFKANDHDLEFNQMRHFIGKGQAGLRLRLRNGWGYNLFVAAKTSDIKIGEKRGHYWAGFSVDYELASD